MYLNFNSYSNIWASKFTSPQETWNWGILHCKFNTKTIWVHKKVWSTFSCRNAKTKTVLEAGWKKVSNSNHLPYSLHILAISSWPTGHPSSLSPRCTAKMIACCRPYGRRPHETTTSWPHVFHPNICRTAISSNRTKDYNESHKKKQVFIK